jgi:hypothetical protein
MVAARRSSSLLRGRYPAVVERDMSRKVDWMSKDDCVTSSITGSNSHRFFLVGTPDGTLLCSPSQDYGTSRGRTWK